jgi:hypothetical protein
LREGTHYGAKYRFLVLEHPHLWNKDIGDIMEGKDGGKKPEDSLSSNLQVSGKDLTQLISYLQELQVKGASTQVLG